MPSGIQLAQISRIRRLGNKLVCPPLRIRGNVLFRRRRHDLAHSLESSLDVQVDHLLQLAGGYGQSGNARPATPSGHEGGDVIPKVEPQQVRQIVVSAQDSLQSQN